MKAKINEADKINQLGQGFCPRCKKAYSGVHECPFYVPKKTAVKKH